MTWNLVTGCTKVSLGCQNCYAEQLARRLQNLGTERYRHGFEVRVHESALTQPLGWSSPRDVFVAPNSDLFHREVPLDFIERVFKVISQCPQHRFQLLTKRATRLQRIAKSLHWPPNLCIGVSVETQRHARRAVVLRDIPAGFRFIAIEPLLGPINRLPLDGIDWVVVGGESGPRARAMEGEWLDSIISQCQNHGVSFVLERWGGVEKFRSARARRRRVPQLMFD